MAPRSLAPLSRPMVLFFYDQKRLSSSLSRWSIDYENASQWKNSVALDPLADSFAKKKPSASSSSSQTQLGSADCRSFLAPGAKYRYAHYIENKDIFLKLLANTKAESSPSPSSSSSSVDSETSFIKALASVGTSLSRNYFTGPAPNARDMFTLTQMLAAGLHIGHATSRWNPNMAPFIHGTRHGIHIIDLEKTLACLRRAVNVTREISRLGGVILFVGTRESIARLVYDAAIATGQFYVNRTWQAGTLTNREQVLRVSADVDGVPFQYTEEDHHVVSPLDMYKASLESPGSLRAAHPLPSPLRKVPPLGPPLILLPDLIIVLDGPSSEAALREAQKVGVPTVALIDSNFDPHLATYPIPGNDDAYSAVELVAKVLERAVLDGKEKRTAQKMPNDLLDSSRSFSRLAKNKFTF